MQHSYKSWFSKVYFARGDKSLSKGDVESDEKFIKGEAVGTINCELVGCIELYAEVV